MCSELHVLYVLCSECMCMCYIYSIMIFVLWLFLYLFICLFVFVVPSRTGNLLHHYSQVYNGSGTLLPVPMCPRYISVKSKPLNDSEPRCGNTVCV